MIVLTENRFLVKLILLGCCFVILRNGVNRFELDENETIDKRRDEITCFLVRFHHFDFASTDGGDLTIAASEDSLTSINGIR